MIHLIVATHGKFSEELVNTAEMVFGETANTHIVTFLPGEGQDDLVKKYENIISHLTSEDKVLFLVDMFGGSPYNAAVRVAVNRPQDNIITGVNLPILLEMLDNKESSTMNELANIAKEVAGLSVKSYRYNEDSSDSSSQSISTSPSSTEISTNTQADNLYDPQGRMKISLLRIDDRLIHGQVLTSWAKAVKCDAIFAISDEVAQDKLRRELLLQIVPEHLKAYVIDIDKAIKVYHNPKYASRNILMLVTKPEDILRLIEGGLQIKDVNVGGMTFKEGNKQLSQAVTVNKSNVEAFKKLLDLGVNLYLQQVASNQKVPLTYDKLNALHF